LPATEGFPESYADFLRPFTIHRSFLKDKEIGNQLAVRLSAAGTSELQRMLSDHFGTKFGFDHEDTCPQTASYSCSNCFHSGKPVTITTFKEQEIFGPCGQCEADAMWVKVGT
jgi:hypothetical protein